MVIGAGPAGSTADKFAAKTGARVILLEKRRRVGVPVQCAEYVPWQITQEVELPKDVIVQRVDSMQTHLPDGTVVETPAKGFIIHRDLFDLHLVKTAVEAGAKIFLMVKALSCENGVVLIRHKKKEERIKAQVIIGADGPHSTVGKWILQSNTKFVHTAQYQMPLCHRLYSTKVYFRKDIPGGYGWVFPKGKVANVGVGIDLQFGVKPVVALRNFVEYLHQEGIIEPEVMNATGGAIPVGGLVNRLCAGNMLLVGDAAGMAHPISGAGVSNAVLSGKIAGEIAAQSVMENNLNKLSEYEAECQMLLGGPLMMARQKRELMKKRWGGNDKELTKIIRSSWIAFEEYYDIRGEKG